MKDALLLSTLSRSGLGGPLCSLCRRPLSHRGHSRSRALSSASWHVALGSVGKFPEPQPFLCQTFCVLQSAERPGSSKHPQPPPEAECRQLPRPWCPRTAQSPPASASPLPSPEGSLLASCVSVRPARHHPAMCQEAGSHSSEQDETLTAVEPSAGMVEGSCYSQPCRATCDSVWQPAPGREGISQGGGWPCPADPRDGQRLAGCASVGHSTSGWRTVSPAGTSWAWLALQRAGKGRGEWPRGSERAPACRLHVTKTSESPPMFSPALLLLKRIQKSAYGGGWPAAIVS